MFQKVEKLKIVQVANNTIESATFPYKTDKTDAPVKSQF